MFDLTILHAAVPPAMQHVAGRSAAGEFICRPAPVSNSDTAASGLPPAKRHLHCAIVLVVCLLANLTTDAATYYVSPAGSDANPGTEAGPFATVHKAAAVAVAGDTARIQLGNYLGTNIVLRTSGNPAAPITFLAVGDVTNNFGFRVNGGVSNIVISGFRRYGHGTNGGGGRATYLASIARGCRDIVITNCFSSGGLGSFGFGGGGVYFDPPGTAADPSLAAQHCTIISNRFDTITNTTATDIHGVGHLVQGNVYANLYSSDALRIFGSNTVIRANLFTNIVGLVGYGNHPDIMQTFGHNGHWMVDFIFEQNRVVNCPVQLMQFQQDIVLGTNLWGITLRNNIFEDSNMQCSISIPNVRFYNNTFYRCSNNAGLFSFMFYDPGSSGGAAFRGSAYGGQMLNNIFVECSGLYSVNNAGPAQGAITTAYTGGGGRTGGGYARITTGSGQIRIWGTYSNLSGTISSGMLAVLNGNDIYSIPSTNFSNGVFDYTQPLVDGAGGYTMNQQYDRFNSFATVFRLNTDRFPTGEAGGQMAQFVPAPSPDLVTDYNFAAGPNGATYRSFTEPNGVNGGNPLFVNLGNSDFRLREGSPLIGKGMPLNNLFTTDMIGTMRGAKWDIGAFQFEAGQAILQPAAPSGLRLVLQ